MALEQQRGPGGLERDNAGNVYVSLERPEGAAPEPPVPISPLSHDLILDSDDHNLPSITESPYLPGLTHPTTASVTLNENAGRPSISPRQSHALSVQ
jgi:hypothetical protein